MKKIHLLTLSLFGFLPSAQVIIGDALGTAAVKTSVLLEFANTNNKGLVLPYVRTLPSSPALGTLLVDATNPSQARVKYYNGGWINLDGTGKSGNLQTILSSQPTGVVEGTSKTIIGARSSAADGVLVLESNTKAMVLPIIDDVNSIPSPSPGMIVYVNKPNFERLAVFNGSIWAFWKP